VRLFRGTQDFDLRFSGLFGNLANATPAAPVGVPTLSNTSATSHGANPRFAAAYRVDPDRTLYASVGKGFRYGGNNQPVPFNFCGIHAPTTFAPDSLWNYEVGSKNTLFDRRVTLNANVYLIDWKNVQVFNSPALHLLLHAERRQDPQRRRGAGKRRQADAPRLLSFSAAYNHAMPRAPS
jgi:iron complex outermembrane receptor protein